MAPRTRRFIAPVLGVLLATCTLAPVASAQTILWNGGTGAGPHSWNVNANWTPAAFPNAAGVTASLIADWSAAPTINLNQAITVGRLFIDDTGGSGDVSVTVAANGGSLTFNNGASAAALETFGSAPLNLITSGVTLTSNLNATINSDTAITGVVQGGGGLTKLGSSILVLSNNNTYSGGTTVSAGTLQIGGGGASGSISGNVSVASDAFLAFRRSDNHTYGSVISGGGGLVKADTGTTILTGANSYTGQTHVLDGVLALGSGGSLASSSMVVTTGATMRFSLNGDYTYSGVISGGGSVSKQTIGELTLTGTNTFSGGLTIDTGGVTIGDGGVSGSLTSNVQNNANLNFHRSDTTTYAGVISGGGNMHKYGTGTLILTGTSDYTGNTNVNAGVLQFGAGGTSGSASSSNIVNHTAVVFNRSDSVTHAGNITSTGTLTQSGTGTLILTGTNTYSGGTTISAGTLQIGTGGTAGSITGNVLNNSALVVNRQGTLTLDGVISGTGSLTKQGSGTLILTGTNAYSGGTTISGGSLQLGNGGTTGSITGNITNNAGVSFNRSDDITFAGTITGSGSLLKDGTGTLILNADHAYNGGTLILDGTLQLGNGGTTGSVTGDIGNFGTLIVNRSNTYDLSGVISLSGTLTKQGVGTLRLGGANTYTGLTTVSGGVLTIGTGGATGSIVSNVLNNSTLIFNRTADYSYAGNISGTGGVFKVNTNTLTLSGTNTYAGTTHIEGGTLVFASGTSLGSGGTIRLSGGVLRWGAGNTTDISTRTVLIDAGGATFDTNVNDIIFANAIGNSGTGALTKTGTGTLILAGNNTYTGGTTISAGTLQIGNGGASGSVIGNIVNNAGLTFNRSDDFTYAGVISGTGSLVKDGAGMLTFTGDHSFTNTTLINNGTLRLGNGGSSGSVTGDIGNLSALIFDRSGAYDYNGVISQNGTVTKQGTGTVRLGGANTYTGVTTISGGVLTIGTGGATGSIVSNVVNNSTLIFNRTTDYTYAGDISGSGSIFKVNSNTLILTGNNTYADTTHIEGGVLEFSSLSNLGNGGTIRFGGGTLRWGAGNTANISTRTIFIDAGGATLDTNGNNVVLTNAIGNGGTGALTKAGAGTLVLAGNNTNTGGTAVSGGVLQIGIGGSTGSVAGDIVNNGTAVIFFRSDATTYAGTISGSGFVQQSGPGQLTFTGDHSYAGSTVLANSSTLQLGNGGTTGSLAGNVNVSTGELIFNRSNDLTYGGVISGTVLGTVTKQGAGRLTLTGANTFTGEWNLNAGTLELGSSGALGTTGTVSFGGGTLRFTASNTTDYSNRFSTAAGQAYSLDTNGQNVTLATGLSSSGGTLTKLGTGTLTLTGSNTFSGGTTISVGTLRLGDGGNTGALSGNIVNNSALVVDRSDTLTYAGVMSGPGTLTKNGAGTLVFTAGNTFNGLTTVNAGTLQFGNGGTAGSASGSNIVNNSAIVYDRSNDIIYNGVISGSGTVTKLGAGQLYLTNDNTYTGLTTISAGDLSLGANGTTGSVAGDIVNNATLRFRRANDFTYAGTISGSGAIIKQSAGTLILTGANTYAGSTSIAGGKLLANNLAGSATGGGNVNVQFGAAATFGGDGAITGSVSVNNSSFLAPGSDGPGDLTVGGVTFSASATYLVELGGLTPGTQYDVLNVTGAANLNGTLDVSLFGGFVPNVGDTFTIINAGSRSGTFAVLEGNGIGYDVTYGSNNVVLTVTAVPEPATLAGFGLAVVGSGGAWWWRRRTRLAETEPECVVDEAE